MFALMIFQLILLFMQFIVIIAHLDKSTAPYKQPDYLHEAGRDMFWNRDKLYKD